MDTLDIEFIDIGEDFLVAKMPVTSKVYQPDGVLHGGATVALAESVGSAVSYMSVDYMNKTVRGIVISANHLKSVKDGLFMQELRLFTREDQLSFGKSKLQTIIII